MLLFENRAVNIKWNEYINKNASVKKKKLKLIQNPNKQITQRARSWVFTLYNDGIFSMQQNTQVSLDMPSKD